MSKMIPRAPWLRVSSALPVPYKLPCTSAHSRKAPCSLKRSSGSSFSIRAVSVVLPAPEGDETISGSGPSFNILDLLPDALELGLHLGHQVGNGGILALSPNCIRFSTDFLQQKVQTAAHGA